MSKMVVSLSQSIELSTEICSMEAYSSVQVLVSCLTSTLI
jgi:hypothetical protein